VDPGRKKWGRCDTKNTMVLGESAWFVREEIELFRTSCSGKGGGKWKFMRKRWGGFLDWN
jgi:hypothetical protein